jgi:glycosyltransferase involved in cell wall biosynthesis
MNSKDYLIDLSIIIITFNEERNLPACLASLPSGSEVIILDSYSSDRTAEIAAAYGARFYSQSFSNFGAQKNAALAYATRRWVLAIDADEVLSPELREEILALISRDTSGETSSIVGYRLRRRLIFLGKLLRFGSTTDYPLRLFQRTQGRFVKPIHEQVEVTGSVAYLQHHLMHNSYRDLSDYFTKFNRYTDQAAEDAFAHRRAQPGVLMLLLRPFYTFCNRYFFHLGFLDGFAGYSYALLSSFYVYTKYAKLRLMYKNGQL